MIGVYVLTVATDWAADAQWLAQLNKSSKKKNVRSKKFGKNGVEHVMWMETSAGTKPTEGGNYKNYSALNFLHHFQCATFSGGA